MGCEDRSDTVLAAMGTWTGEKVLLGTPSGSRATPSLGCGGGWCQRVTAQCGTRVVHTHPTESAAAPCDKHASVEWRSVFSAG
jgi:hypothetical protein